MEIKEVINEVINESFRILSELKKTGFSNETKLIIPNRKDCKNSTDDPDSKDAIRVSEQELRFVFVEQLNKKLSSGYYYSIETPTDDKYKFSENGKECKPVRGIGQSGNFDLTIQNANKEKIAIIEFKSKSATHHSYAKDLCKLWNKDEGKEDKTLRYFINVFETMDGKTRGKVIEKITNNEYFQKQADDISVTIVCKSLTEGQKEFELFKEDDELKTYLIG